MTADPPPRPVVGKVECSLDGTDPETAKPAGMVWLADVVADVLRSPAGRAAIAECVRRPPVRMRDGTWREPTPGSEAVPGDWVRRIGEQRWHEVERVGDGGIWTRDGLRRNSWQAEDVEVVMPAEHREALRAEPLARDRQAASSRADRPGPSRDEMIAWCREEQRREQQEAGAASAAKDPAPSAIVEDVPAICPRCWNTGIESVPTDGFNPTGRRTCSCEAGRKRSGL